jgi:3-dehydroquinate dehydratase / shikimate dehydrogenase
MFVTDVAQAKRDIAAAAEAGADMVELRIDRIRDYTILKPIIEAKILPIIVTCRASWEGGESDLPDDERGLLLSQAADDGAEFVDLELETARKNETALRNAISELRPPIQTKLILSSHHFRGRPDRLNNLLHELSTSIADVSKIVWTARSIRENFEVFEILQLKLKPTIALCMGEAGLISRVLAKKFGGFLTFASLGKDAETAPGQVSIHDMKNLYRWDALNEKTKVYGVVGSPIAHSMSPALHNAAFTETQYDGLYLPLLVEPSYESFKAFMETFMHFEPLDLSGLSITIPHKENALRYLKEKGGEIEELAERIGAVNTITIRRDSGRLQLSGKNTDYAAILDSVTDKMNITRDDLAELRVAVIGAGGTGRTAVAALASCGATVVVYNRTKERADALAKEFDGKSGKVVSARMEKLCDSCCHIFINTTSVGMRPNIDASPIDGQSVEFSPDTVVFDAVYNPIKTKFLAQAEASGAKTIGGVEMFVRQAAGQFKTWTGKEPPMDVFRRIVELRLTQKS